MAPGLAKLTKSLGGAATPARRELALKDLRHQPAANNNFELDPLDLVDVMVTLGEAAPAVLFLFPMWAAASAYLKDPQYYLNKPKPQCGDDARSQKKGRPLEWAPLKRFAPTHHDYRNPSLSDAERQKLLEWLQPEKFRGNYTGAEGLPKGLPQDPKRDDSFVAPIDPRNMVMDRPVGDAMPATERALPDLQQDDVQRRLMMGDAAPGRERHIGDFLGQDTHERGARDFLVPSENTTETAPLSMIPDIRMQRGQSIPDDVLRKRPKGPFAEAMTEYTILKRHVAQKLFHVMSHMHDQLAASKIPTVGIHLDQVIAVQDQDEDWMDAAIGDLGLMALRKLGLQRYSGRLILQWRVQLTHNQPDPREYEMGLVDPLGETSRFRPRVINDLGVLASVMGWHPELGRHHLEPLAIQWKEWTPASLDKIHDDYRAKMLAAELNRSRAGKEVEPDPREVPLRRAIVRGRVSPPAEKGFKFGKQGKKQGPRSTELSPNPIERHHMPMVRDDGERVYGVGVPRDAMGLRVGQAALANIESSPHLARMSDSAGGTAQRGNGRVSGAGSYVGEFRRRNSAPAVPAVQVQTPPSSPSTTSPPVDKDITPIVLPMVAPEKSSLTQLEAVLRALFQVCPVDDRGFVDITPLRVGRYLVRDVQFSDGSRIKMNRLLMRHDDVLSAEERRRLSGSPGTEARLVSVFRRVTGNKSLRPMTDRVIAQRIYKLDTPRVDIKSAGPLLTTVLRKAWEASVADGRPVSSRSIRDTMLESNAGERVRILDVLRIYWDDLHHRLAKRGVVIQKKKDLFETDDALNLMYFDLFGRVRINPMWKGTHTTVINLAYGKDEALMDVESLSGALRALYLLSQTEWMQGHDRFPHEIKNELVVVADPRVGRVANYESVLRRTHELLVEVMQDPKQRDLLRGIVVDPNLVGHPENAAKLIPRMDTRTTLLQYVVKHKGLAEPVRTVVRRSSGTVVPVLKPKRADTGGFSEMPFALDMTDARGVGIRRDAMGLRVGQAALANVESSPHLARMSDGPTGVGREVIKTRTPSLPRLPHKDRMPHLLQSARREAILRQAKAQGPLRSTALPFGDVKLPIEFLWAYQNGTTPTNEGPEGLPMGRAVRIANLTVWRLNTNVAFVRSDKKGQQDLVSLCFGANEIPGYPEFKKTITLDDLRYMARERKTADLTITRNGVKYVLRIIPVYDHRNGERVSFLVSPPNDFDHGTIIPWRSQWMTSSIMDDLIGVSK